MNPLLNVWTIDWASLLVLAVLGGLYGLVAGWRLQPGAGIYGAGLVLIALAQASPLHVLGMYYPLSAHMVTHMLLLLVAAPLLVLGLPGEPSRQTSGLLHTVSRFFNKQPWVGWLLGLGTMWFWHIPAVHDTAIAPGSEGVYGNLTAIPLCTVTGPSAYPLVNLLHLSQPISLVLAGMGFAWPVIGPFRSDRIHPLKGVVYLATACAGCSLLGMLITFAPVGIYQTNAGVGYYGIGGLVRQEGTLDPATDQQMAGLLMWVPGCLIYLTGALALFITWLTDRPEPVGEPIRNLLIKEKTG